MARAINPAVWRAAEHLGVEDPVVIQYLDGGTKIGVSGFYRRQTGWHEICVATELSPRAMSQTIYHELEHARQCEMLHGGDADAYHQAVVDAAFEAIKLPQRASWYELQARAAERLDDQVRLCENDEGGYSA